MPLFGSQLDSSRERLITLTHRQFCCYCTSGQLLSCRLVFQYRVQPWIRVLMSFLPRHFHSVFQNNAIQTAERSFLLIPMSYLLERPQCTIRNIGYSLCSLLSSKTRWCSLLAETFLMCFERSSLSQIQVQVCIQCLVLVPNQTCRNNFQKI